MATLDKVSELGDYLREQRQGAKLSLRQLAEVAGVSNPYLSQVERGLRRPSAEVLQQIAKGLRISAEALYVRAGILEERADRITVEAAVLADPKLGERQRRVLLDIYATFCAEQARQDAAADPVGDAGATEEPAAAGGTKAGGTKAGARSRSRTADRTTPAGAEGTGTTSTGRTRARSTSSRATARTTTTGSAGTERTSRGGN